MMATGLMLAVLVWISHPPGAGWRSLGDAAVAAEPAVLSPGSQLHFVPLPLVIAHWLLTAAMAAFAGMHVWTRHGGARGFGVQAACLAFGLSLGVEFTRWFTVDELPDVTSPFIALAVATISWRLCQRLPIQPVTRLPRRGPWGTRIRIALRFALLMSAAGAAVAVGLIGVAIGEKAPRPKQIHDALVALPTGRTGAAAVVANAILGAAGAAGAIAWLDKANRLDPAGEILVPAGVGARDEFAGILPAGRLRPVSTQEALRQAISTAEPGDVILMQPGKYLLKDSVIHAGRAGRAGAPIVVRAARPGQAVIEAELLEAIKVTAPYWSFQNLVLRGICPDDSNCDNGFHIAGKADNTILDNVRIEDFNAHIKINGENGDFPDHGLIRHATLIDTHPRRTESSVVAVDLVGANDWVLEQSLIADIAKTGNAPVSYGAYAKGAAHGTRFSRNVVLCAWHSRESGGQRVGMSFGGGGTGTDLTRDRGESGYEHADGIMDDNLIAFCSDEGIYLNRAAGTVLRHNTLLATLGVDARYIETIVIAQGNIVDGMIRGRDGGMVRGEGNLSDTLTGMFSGRNSVRALFADPAALDLRWSRRPANVAADPGIDLCGQPRDHAAAPGAFQDYAACRPAARQDDPPRDKTASPR